MSDFLPENGLKLELKEKITNPNLKKREKIREKVVREARGSHQERLQQAIHKEVAEYGFTSEERDTQLALEERFRDLAKQSESDSDRFLELLQEQEVIIIRNSKHLEHLIELRRKVGRFDPNLQEVQAAYVTQSDISMFTEGHGDKFPEHVKNELEHARQGVNGAIFLGNNATSLAKWHEGAHAIQHIKGWDSRKSGKAKTEIGVNLTLLKAHDANPLADVTTGDYLVIGGEFSKPKALPKTNDIYKELEDLERNVG